MAQATARFLHGRDFRGLGLSPRLEPFAIATNLLPRPLRRLIYIKSGAMEAIPPARLGEISRGRGISVGDRPLPAAHFPRDRDRLVERRPGPSVRGARHPMAATDGLIPVRQSAFGPDEPVKAMRFGAEHAPRLLDANPDLQLHHMHDPNQDRLMAQSLAYFRVKRLRLGSVYEQFILDRLGQGGTIILADCRLRWPTTRVGDRHFFQFGGFGDASAAEYLEGSPRVTEFLKRQNSSLRRWDPPRPDADSPELEWGFEAVLAQDVERCARERGYRVVRLGFDEPDDLAAPIADLYRKWYARSGVPGHRLLVESRIARPLARRADGLGTVLDDLSDRALRRFAGAVSGLRRAL